MIRRGRENAEEMQGGRGIEDATCGTVASDSGDHGTSKRDSSECAIDGVATPQRRTRKWTERIEMRIVRDGSFR